MMQLDSILEDASFFIKSEFNLELQKSKLKIYSSNNWNTFCQDNNFDSNTDGLYIPASYSAYVRTDNQFLTSNIFHELYGHGLFYEFSLIGKKLTEIIDKNEDENEFLFNKLNRDRQPFGILDYNIQNYEGFAVWLEELLCKETGNEKVWELKKRKLPKHYNKLLEYFKTFEEQNSRFSLKAQLGFPKYYDEKKLLDITKQFYGNLFQEIEYIVLYGSKKPESDIDLFIVSNNPTNNYFNGWLDIYEVNKEEFKIWSEKLDISITDPLFSGKLIYGNESTYEANKHKIRTANITQNQIEHNLQEARLQTDLLVHFSDTDKRKKDGLTYTKSFTANAKQLSLGNKALTLENLKKYLH